MQIVWPAVLSGDYSAPSEPIPDRLVFPESILGALFLVGPLLAAAYIALFVPRTPAYVLGRSTGRDDRQLVAVALVWIVVFYFPVSNIPVVLPTVRAERFWYFPAFATAILVALAFERIYQRGVRVGLPRVAESIAALYLLFQGLAARHHADDYRDDLTFWRATRRSVPRSAKAQLNYGVMLGTRGDLAGRAAATREALALAPQWPMASVYLADALCRQHHPFEAWPYYRAGFQLGPNDKGLIALGLQCLWDEKALSWESSIRPELEESMAANPRVVARQPRPRHPHQRRAAQRRRPEEPPPLLQRRSERRLSSPKVRREVVGLSRPDDKWSSDLPRCLRAGTRRPLPRPAKSDRLPRRRSASRR